MATLGYAAGQPFGDPTQFTRSTGEAELDRFNQWLRQQPFWQQARALKPAGDMTDAQRSMIAQGLQRLGVTLPGSFVIDTGGNLNQTNRLDDTLKWAAIAGLSALGGAGLMGVGPLGGSLGGLFGGGAGTAAGATAGSVLPSSTSAATSALLGSTALPTTTSALTGSALAGSTAAGATAGSVLPSTTSAATSALLGSTAPTTTSALMNGGGTAGTAVFRALQPTAGGTGSGFDWLDLLKVAGPLGGLITSQVLDRGNQRPQLDPALMAQMQELIGLQTDRARASAPVHAAAMQMAQRMANTGADSPRLNQTIQDVSRPLGAPTTDPQVLAAINRLAGR